MGNPTKPEILVDTNIIVRLFDLKDERQRSGSQRLFADAKAGLIRLIVGPPVLFELAWVLRSVYGRSQEEILDIIEALTNWPGVQVLDSELAASAILLAKRTSQGFADAYVAATAKKHGLKVATYNVKHFSKLDVDLHAI